MKYYKSLFMAVIAMCATASVGFLFAQDDLDSLLSDLEGDSKKAAAKPAEKKAEEKSEAVAEKKEEVKAEEKSEAVAEKKEEAKAEEKSEAVAEKKEEVKAEEKSEAVAEKKEEAKAEEKTEAVAEKKEEAKAEEKTEAVAEKKEEAKAESGASTAEVSNFLDDLAAVPGSKKKEAGASSEKAEASSVASSEKPVRKGAKPKAAVKLTPEQELVSDIMAYETLRREAMDRQAVREIEEARAAMDSDVRDWDTAFRKYSLAFKHLSDRADTLAFKKECANGMAEAKYRWALEELAEGNRDEAWDLAQEAKKLRHPRVGELITRMETQLVKKSTERDVSEIAHRRHDQDYREDRDSIRMRLRKSAQYLATSELDKALDECELVLRHDPYNREALALRDRIQHRREVILEREFAVTRRGMIADVKKAWRPVYAVNAAELSDIDAGTSKNTVGDDPVRSAEQAIEKRMQEMVLPTIAFRPPATIGDAVDFFRQASKDFDRPEIPLDQRGFNIVLDLGRQLRGAGGGGEGEEKEGGGNDFSDNGDDKAEGSASTDGLPQIPNISASNVTFWEALKLVCQVTGFKFKVEGPILRVMPKDMTTEELVTRSYNVTENFAERMSGASEEAEEGGAFGGGSKKKSDEGEATKEEQWKNLFEMMGVTWPKNSRIVYLKTIGKLRVTNTAEQLAMIEQALSEMNMTPRLIEIETRFVEVAQEDLNSLGFEWLLNSDYTLGGGQNAFTRALGIKGGSWQDKTTTTTTKTQVTLDGGATYQDATVTTTTTDPSTKVWTQNGGSGVLGVNATGGSTGYGSGMRYLSTTGNTISGAGQSTNDQFMRVNAFIGNADLSMILHMLSQRSDTDLLSAPKVVTKNGEEATIKVVTKYRYPQEYEVTISQSSSGSSSSSSSGSSMPIAMVEPQSFEVEEVGVILQVTPDVTADGQMINLDLHPRVVSEPTWKDYGMSLPIVSQTDQGFGSIGEIMTTLVENIQNIGAELTQDEKNALAKQLKSSAMNAIDNIGSGESSIKYYKAPMEQPFFKYRQIDTKMSIYNGATVVMGGLITEERKSMEDKIMFLGDIPYIGRFFRSRAEWSNKRNLLIFVTARLVDPNGRQIAVGNSEASVAGEADKVTAAPAKN